MGRKAGSIFLLILKADLLPRNADKPLVLKKLRSK
jgi:hypothetical protein